MTAESSDIEIRRKIGKHPLGRLLDTPGDKARNPAPMLNLHWPADGVKAG